MKSYLGVDPGLTTGYALVDENEVLLDCGVFKEFFPTINGILQLANISGNLGYEVFIVVEDFDLFPYTAREVSLHDYHMHTPKLIGALTYIFNEANFVLRKPSDKSACPDELLKQLHLWSLREAKIEDRADIRHVHDAIRHTIIELRRQQDAGKPKGSFRPRSQLSVAR